MPDDPQPSSELASFGEELRREREIRGISLKEISDATKISKRFLEAIERNDHRTLPAPVFTRGFVREYARYLDFRTELADKRVPELARAFRDALGRALDAFARAVAVDTGYALAWANLGAIRRELGDDQAAESALARAIQLNPKPAFSSPFPPCGV